MRSRCARTVVLVCLGLSVVLIRPAAAAETRITRAQKAVAGMIEKSSVRPVETKVIAVDARRIVQSLDEEQITRLYANVGGLNIANGLVVPIAGVSTQPFDLSVLPDVSGAYLVADVTGYFTRFPVEQF